MSLMKEHNSQIKKGASSSKRKGALALVRAPNEKSSERKNRSWKKARKLCREESEMFCRSENHVIFETYGGTSRDVDACLHNLDEAAL